MEFSEHGPVSDPVLGDPEPDEQVEEPELEESERGGTDAARGEQSENR
jgi:hypothetical protein